MKITICLLGQIDHQKFYEITMKHDSRMEVRLLTYGAAIRQILVPDRQGILRNVVLGYENWMDYICNPLYAGATLCPNAGRISQAECSIDGHLYHLTPNDGRHNLHGGDFGASFKNWGIDTWEAQEDFCSVSFSVTLNDGTDGFPGNRHMKVCYTLRNNGTLRIEYFGTTDRSTYLNLSNHSYFNLTGDFASCALSQELELNAGDYLQHDREHIPVSMAPVAQSPFDFRTPQTLSANIAKDPSHPQLQPACGYNHGFLLSDAVCGDTKKALSLTDHASGRKLSLYTDAPCVVLYSGGCIDNSHLLLNRTFSYPSCALALEAQDIPDVAHSFPSRFVITRPGEEFRRTIVFEFSPIY